MTTNSLIEKRQEILTWFLFYDFKQENSVKLSPISLFIYQSYFVIGFNVSSDEDAPFRVCTENQVYNGCLKPSRDLRTCRMFRQNHPEIEEATSPGCKCKEGFYLEKGVCIPESQCPEYPGEYTGMDQIRI